MSIFKRIGEWLRRKIAQPAGRNKESGLFPKIPYGTNLPEEGYLEMVFPKAIRSMERVYDARRKRKEKADENIAELTGRTLSNPNKDDKEIKSSKPRDEEKTGSCNLADGQKLLEYYWYLLSADYKIPCAMKMAYDRIIRKLVDDRIDGNALRLTLCQVLGTMAAAESWRSSQSAGSASLMALAEIEIIKEKLNKITQVLEQLQKKE